MRNIALTVGALFVLGMGCGGKAVIDGPNNNTGGSGGTSGSGGSTPASSVNNNSSSVNNSSSASGMPLMCNGLQDCCQQMCDKGASVGLGCWPPNGDCNCETLVFDDECESSLAALFACAGGVDPFGYTCNAGGQILICGNCDAEASAVQASCGFEQPCE